MSIYFENFFQTFHQKTSRQKTTGMLYIIVIRRTKASAFEQNYTRRLTDTIVLYVASLLTLIPSCELDAWTICPLPM